MGCRWLLSVSGLSVELSPFARPLPVGYSRNSWHKGRQSGDNTKERGGYWTGVLRAAFRILSQNGYSRKNPDQFLGLWPLCWLPRSRAKNCLYPKGRSIKKLHTKETDNIKECLTTLEWTISYNNLFHLNRSRRNTKRRRGYVTICFVRLYTAEAFKESIFRDNGNR